jgi:phosphoribosyl-ATP pyrophosphohydrolase
MSILQELADVLEQRKTESPDISYVASLYQRGTNKILEKIGEEATEVIIAAKDIDQSAEANKALVQEVADLWFHCMVMLAHKNIDVDDVLLELQGRFGIGGHAEKASRDH